MAETEMQHRMRIVGAVLTFALTLGACFAGSSVAAEQLKIASPQRGSWEGAVPELGQERGIFKKYGLDLDILYTSGGGETLQTVISGAVDIGLSAGTLSILGAFQKGAPLRIIGASSTGSRELFWYVPQESQVRAMREANDRTIGYSTGGSSTHITVLRFIDEYKLNAKPVATGDVSATITQVMSKQVDIGWSVAPFELKGAGAGQDPNSRTRERSAVDSQSNHSCSDHQRSGPGAEEGQHRTLHQGLSRNDRLHVCGGAGAAALSKILRLRGGGGQADPAGVHSQGQSADGGGEGARPGHG
jgi:hypothetical protein